jgi:hypothetical protein
MADDDEKVVISLKGQLPEDKDEVEELVKEYFHYLRYGERGHGVTLLTSLQWANRKFDIEDFQDLQEFLRDILLDARGAS